MVIPVLANYVNGRWVTPDTAQSVDVREERAGEWSVEQSSVPAEKVSSSVTRFKVSVPARGETVLTYRIRAVW